jgi:hypothetical protein
MDMFLITLKVVFVTLACMFAWVVYKMIKEHKHKVISREVKLSKKRLFR